MEFVQPLLGGALIGVAAAMLLWFNGRVAGITGILAELIAPRPGELGWRLAFLGGMALGALALIATLPAAFGVHPERSLAGILAAGLLVGVGTRMSNGCTSGHGVCGIPRGSTRSIVATVTFMATGVLAVLLFGGAA